MFPLHLNCGSSKGVIEFTLTNFCDNTPHIVLNLSNEIFVNPQKKDSHMLLCSQTIYSILN